MSGMTTMAEVGDLLEETDEIAVELAADSDAHTHWDVYVPTGCPGMNNHGSYWSTVDISVVRELAGREHFTVYDRATREPWADPEAAADPAAEAE